MRKASYRLLAPFFILFFIVICGIGGYMIIENTSFLDALFMTTISITTVGYGEVVPLSSAGKTFTIILLIVSWVTFAFAVTRITQFVVTGEFNQYFKMRRLMKEIEKLDKHVIICGYGRNGQQAAQVLRSNQIPFIVIEKSHNMMAKSMKDDDDLVHLEGDSTDDDILQAAGIQRAIALITTLPIDADNLFIVLSARGLNPNLQIISRASDSNSIAKLKKAGANNVIMPDRIGGTHMATLISKPDVVEFINFLSGESGSTVNIESVSYEQLPEQLRGKPLDQIMNWNKTGVNCIGVKSAEGKFQINPPYDIILYPGMKIIVLGSRNEILRMKANLV